MPTERILVGGGTMYDNTHVSSTHKSYYKFSVSDNYVNNTEAIIYSGNRYNNSSLIDGTTKSINYVNNLFTGILPYQSIYDSFYKNSMRGGTTGYVSRSKAYFSFGLPVVITKYRMYNAFGAGVIGNLFDDITNQYGDMSDQTPQDWYLSGTNDGVTWTTVDARTSQGKFPNATSKLARNCSYSEYSVSGATAYKNYRLIVTKGGRSVSDLRNEQAFQIGEMQILGYESPSTPCELHGGYTLFPTAKCIDGSGSVLVETPGTGHRSSFARVFSNLGFRYCANISSDFGLFPNQSSSVSSLNKYYDLSRSAWGPFETGGVGYLDFGVAVTLSYYNITSGIYADNYNRGYRLTAWTLYGSNDNSTWNSLDNRSGSDTSYSGIYKYNITSPASYRYYKMEIKNNKSSVNSLQFVGYVS